jgi:hypothetical protein
VDFGLLLKAFDMGPGGFLRHSQAFDTGLELFTWSLGFLTCVVLICLGLKKIPMTHG